MTDNKISTSRNLKRKLKIFVFVIASGFYYFAGYNVFSALFHFDSIDPENLTLVGSLAQLFAMFVLPVIFIKLLFWLKDESLSMSLWYIVKETNLINQLIKKNREGKVSLNEIMYLEGLLKGGYKNLMQRYGSELTTEEKIDMEKQMNAIENARRKLIGEIRDSNLFGPGVKIVSD